LPCSQQTQQIACSQWISRLVNLQRSTLLERFEQEKISNESQKKYDGYLEENENDFFFTQVKDYELNFTSKQLIAINDYYGLGNTSKMKKLDIIERIVDYENNDENYDIVNKRQTLWFYIDELKKDPYTKKFVWAL